MKSIRNLLMKITFRTVWGVAWRLILSLTGVAVIMIACMMCYAYHDAMTDYRYDMRLSEDIESRYCEAKEEMGIYDIRTGKYTIKGIKWVVKAGPDDSLTVYCKDGKRGFLNVNTGKAVIPEQYMKAWVFSEGLAAVMQDGKIGFIGPDGNVVLPFRYDYAYKGGQQIDYVFRGGYCTMTDSTGACGLIDRHGDWVVEPMYDFIFVPDDGKCRVVRNDGRYGLMDENFDFIFPIEYDCIEYSGDNGVLLTKDGRRWKAGYDGTVLEPFVCSSIEYLYCPSGCKNYPDDDYIEECGATYSLSGFLKYGLDGKYGVVRSDNGKVVIPALYEEIDMVSPTLFEVQKHEDEGWILVDTDGNFVDKE